MGTKNMIAAAVVAGAINAAITSVKGMARLAGWRVGEAGLAGAIQAVVARRRETWHEVVLVPVPGTAAAVGAGNGRTVGLPKQARFGVGR